MGTITYARLTRKNFTEKSLDQFKRFQQVNQCWRKSGNHYELVKNEFTENWNLAKLGNVAKDTLAAIDKGCIVYGAFMEAEIVGFVYLGSESFGRNKQSVELQMLQVSQPYRKQGIGKNLFQLACTEAKLCGFSKLYISAHPSKESQAFYTSIGCLEAIEINEAIFGNEPYDVQMEYAIK